MARPSSSSLAMAAARALALLGAAALLAAAPSLAARTTYTLNVPARYQYDQNGGYCGELSLQQLMLRHGAWIPQELARRQGGGELLLGVNYDTAMTRLKIKYETWTGTGYRAFYAWAKGKIVRSVGVVFVAFVRGLGDPDYDHIMPLVGIETSTAGDGGYADGDHALVNTGYGAVSVRRTVGGPSPYSCAAGNKTYTIDRGGCVPVGTSWAVAIAGPVYAGIGPNTHLTVPTKSEPGVGKPGVLFNATLRTSGLVIGRKYRLYKVTDLARVPAAATAAAAATLAARDLLREFVATGATKSDSVTFVSNLIAYFICVAV